MKTILSILGSLLILLFITSALYVFGLPPFNPGGPFDAAHNSNSTSSQQPEQPLPDFLSDEKIGRAKTYTEYMNRGALLEKNSYHALAIAEYEAAAKLAPNSIEALMEIGKIHMRQMDYINAKVSFETALKIEPNNLSASIYLARAMLANREIESAKKVLDGLTEQNQESKYYQGIIAAFVGDYDNSKRLLNEAVSIGTSADITAKAQNYLSAYEEYDFNKGAPLTNLKTLLARSFDQTGQYNMAIPILFEVVRDKKDYRDAWIIMGHAYLEIGKYQDAQQALETAKKLDPQNPQALFYAGLTYYALNDLPNAASNLELAKKYGYQPSAQIDQKLSEIYLQQKQYDKAAQAYENVIALVDTDVYYYIKPIWIYLERLNQPRKAMTLAKLAYKKHPRDAMTYNLLGWAAIGNNLLNEAGKYLDQAKAINPNLDAIYLNYGRLYEKIGQTDKAFAAYKKAFEMGSGNSISAAAAERYNNLIALNKENKPNQQETKTSSNSTSPSPTLPLSYLQ
jgi:tetratricopeptide (TPR) repeat protein